MSRGGPFSPPPPSLFRVKVLEALFCLSKYLSVLVFTCRIPPTSIQGGPERTQHLRSIISRKRGTEWKSCVHYCIWNYFSSKMTPRSLISMKAFWFYGRFSEAMSFSRFALLSPKMLFTYQKLSIVWLPRVKCLLLLCKAKPAWIKRSIHYVNLLH